MGIGNRLQLVLAWCLSMWFSPRRTSVLWARVIGLLIAELSAFWLMSPASATDISGDLVDPDYHQNQAVLIEHPNEEIDLFTGRLRLHYVDIELPGNGGFSIQVRRNYDASKGKTDLSEATGRDWSMHFGRVKASAPSLAVGCNNSIGSSRQPNVVFERPDGRVETFHVPDAGIPKLVSPSLWRLDCAGSGPSAGFSVTSPEGVRYEMGSVSVSSTDLSLYWYPTRIVDVHGNYIDLAYQTPPSSSTSHTPYVHLSTVTAADGRKLTFAYVGELLSSITADDGRVWQYKYQQFKRQILFSTYTYYLLTQVIRPDNSGWTYQYHPSIDSVTVADLVDPVKARSLRMQSVTYPWGGSVSYDYNFVSFKPQFSPLTTANFLVLRSKSTSDGGSWAFSYVLSAQQGVLDTTTVTTSDKRIQVQHFGYGTIARAFDAYTIGNNSSCWMAGLPASRTVTNSAGIVLERESYSWTPALVASFSGFSVPYQQNTSCPDISRPVQTRVVRERDGTAYTTTYADFDAYDNPRTIKDSGNAGTRTTTRSYCVNNSQGKWLLHRVGTETIDAGPMGGGTISRSYDSSCTDLLAENRFGVTSSYTYFGDGSLHTKTYPRAQYSSTYSDYYRGIPRLETHPEGVMVNRTVSSAGCVLSSTDGEGHITNLSCDGLNRTTGVAPPLGNPTAIGFSATPPITRTLTRGSYQEIKTLDGFGRLIQVDAGKLNWQKLTRKFAYDAIGRLKFESNPAPFPGTAAGKRYDYDALDRVKSITEVDAANAVLAPARTFDYLSGNAMQSKDEQGRLTRLDYISFGNPDEKFLTAITPPAGTNANTTIGRNFLGQITSVSQGVAGASPGVVTRNFGYDSRFYVKTITEPEHDMITFGRDEAGNMVSRQIGNSSPTSFIYDGLNRLTSTVYPVGSAARNVTQQWDKNGKLIYTGNDLSKRILRYDDNGNLTQEQLDVDGRQFLVAYGYDRNDYLDSVAHPKFGTAVSYAPDEFGRPTQALPFASSVTYHPNGQIRSILFANGVTSSFGQDARLRPSSISTWKFASYIDLAYRYSDAGNVTSIVDAANPNNNRSLSYDDIDRLNNVQVGGVNFPILYDGVGNITQQNFGGQLNYGYDATRNRINAITGAQSYFFAYDGAGNVTRNGRASFSYDDASMLRRVDTPSGPIDYEYDSLGLRTLVRKGGKTTYSFYGISGKLLLDFDPAANMRKEHFYVGSHRIAMRTDDAVLASSLTLTASTNRIDPGQFVSLNASVTGNAAGGLVTFYDNGVAIGAANVENGVATLTTTGLNFGYHRFTATYDGVRLPSATASSALVAAGNIAAVMTVINSLLLTD